jgi:hypothetical protein
VLPILGQCCDDLVQARSLLSSSVDSDEQLRQLEELYCCSCTEEPVVAGAIRPEVGQKVKSAMVAG